MGGLPSPAFFHCATTCQPSAFTGKSSGRFHAKPKYASSPSL
jgi:hypothetical protein